jgi:hypothetical protein
MATTQARKPSTCAPTVVNSTVDAHVDGFCELGPRCNDDPRTRRHRTCATAVAQRRPTHTETPNVRYRRRPTTTHAHGDTERALPPSPNDDPRTRRHRTCAAAVAPATTHAHGDTERALPPSPRRRPAHTETPSERCRPHPATIRAHGDAERVLPPSPGDPAKVRGHRAGGPPARGPDPHAAGPDPVVTQAPVRTEASIASRVAAAATASSRVGPCGLFSAMERRKPAASITLVSS